MDQVFDQTNMAKLNYRMSVELVNAVWNIRTGLKIDNMIMTVLRSSDNMKFYWHLFGIQ